MKRAILLICCMAMLLSVLTGCNFGKIPDDESADTKNDVVTEDDGEETDEGGYVKDSIGDVKFNGEEIKIMAWGSTAADYDFNVDTSTGDKIAKQTFVRNNNVAVRLNVRLNFNRELVGDNADRYNYVSTVERNLGAGEKYDIIACYSQCAANFAIDGFVVDLKQYGDIIELTKPWWSSNMVESSVVNNKLYFASGSISATSILQTFVIAVNMDKIASMGEDDPRELAKDGKWTMETFYNMCKETYLDLNQKVIGKDAEDEFGFTTVDTVVGDGFFTGNGLTYVKADNTGKLILSPDFEGVKTDTLINDLMTKFNTNDYMYGGGQGIFENKRALFIGTSFWVLMERRSEMEFNYGYVPYPMADEYQGEYYSTCGFPFTMWCITTSAPDAERAAYTMEALASASYRTIQPELYNNIKYRLSDESINADMFNLIIESKTYDMGRIFHNIFAWEDSPVALFRTKLYNGYENGQGWASLLVEKKPALSEGLGEINRAFGY